MGEHKAIEKTPKTFKHVDSTSPHHSNCYLSWLPKQCKELWVSETTRLKEPQRQRNCFPETELRECAADSR